MDALILCAGYGTRLAPLTDRTPKPLVPVADKLSIEHQLEKLKSIGVDRIFINAHHLADQLVDFAEESPLIDECFVEKEILGTGGPLRRVFQEKASEELLVLNGDVFHHLDLEKFVLSSRESDSDFALLMMDNPEVNSVGISNNLVKTVRKVYGEDENCEDFKTFTGISWWNQDALSNISEEYFSIVNFWKDQASLGNFPYAQVQSSTWIDIGTPQGLWNACCVRWRELEMWPIYNWVALESRSPIPQDEGPGLYGRDFQWKLELPSDEELMQLEVSAS